jgi:transaldolase/glucose-6-phosphate isomerase
LEVNPHLAHDTSGAIEEGRRLWAALNRPNVLIKVPATLEGLPAIEQLISEGINVNVTLIFGITRYRQVADAYLTGIERRSAAGQTLNTAASVASFFVSRIDSMVDPILEKLILQSGEIGSCARQLHGQIAVASAKAAYQVYKEMFSSDRFLNLAEQGAPTQRPLWASTGTKNPQYSNVKYIDALVGRDTVNTAPIETLNEYRDHGDPKDRIELDVSKARQMLNTLPDLGINIERLTQQLEDDGVAKFNEAFDKLIDALTTALKP